jgi:hypothetical protein
MASPEAGPSPHPGQPPVPWRRIAWITLAAAALIAAVHLIPGRLPLSHMDFIPGGPGAVEFCDPQNPRVIAVASKPSSATLSLAPAAPLTAGSTGPSVVRLALRTASGKAVGPDDLAWSPAGELRLFILGANLADFQTARPAPGARRGDWTFEFIPRSAGIYRVFADMTPVATGRELYTSADLWVSGPVPRSAGGFTARAQSEGVSFELRPAGGTLYAHSKAVLRLVMARPDGHAVGLMPLQGASALLVLFDEDRNGFLSTGAPAGNGGPEPDASRPSFDFDVSFPDPGRYVAWVRVNIAGRETAVPLGVEVSP